MVACSTAAVLPLPLSTKCLTLSKGLPASEMRSQQWGSQISGDGAVNFVNFGTTPVRPQVQMGNKNEGIGVFGPDCCASAGHPWGQQIQLAARKGYCFALSGRPTLSSIAVWNGAICSTTYGSTNGNGRPGRGAKKTGDGYNSGFLTEEPESSQGQSPYSRQDLEMERISEAPAKRKRKPFGLRNGEAPQSGLSEKRGEDSYRVLENGQKVYLDELDVITLLEPPPFLRPLPSVYYNHAAFLWKKIGDIPEERRPRLLDLLLPRHITKMWELSGLRYEDPDAFTETAADMLPRPDVSDGVKPTVWDGRVIQVPWYLKMFSRFQKIFFIGGDNKIYGRVITGGKLLSRFGDRLAPLYFEVMHADSVMATEEPCDLVLEYGDGQLHLCNNIPPGFAKPVKHLSPFNDKACDYLRAVGPGVMVGQGWVEGRRLEQFPRRLFGEFIMVKRI